MATGCSTTRGPAQTTAGPAGWPVPRDTAVITSVFGEPRRGGRHEGIDLSSPEGTVVVTTAAGVVSFAGRSGDWGRSVVVDHGDGWQTRYAHLKRIKIDRGRKLKCGDVIGTVGKSGNATGYHLHYEVLKHGKPVDPRPLMNR